MAGGHCVWVSIQSVAQSWPTLCDPMASLSITNSWSLLKLMPIQSGCHPPISSSVVPFSSCLQSLSPSGSFPMSQFFASGSQCSDSSFGKESACNAGDRGLIPRSGRSAGEGIGYPLQYSWASLVAQLVKNPPAMPETWIWSLGWEDPLKKGIPTPVFWPRESHGLYRPWG